MERDPFADLSEAHRRGIRATLVYVDEALCEIEQWAEGRELHSELYQEQNNLSPEQRRHLLEELAGMRPVLAALRDALEIEVECRSAVDSVRGLSMSLWPHLVELKGKYLRRYGKTPPEAVAYLNPHVEELITRIKRIADIARGR
jgi:hypothetical protein